MSGLLISIEGGEGTGKSTQADLLADKLLERYDFPVLLTKEPGSPHDPVCGKIREILLDPEHNVSEKSAMLLFLADRAQHMEEVIAPILEDDGIVISDRSSLSTVVYHLAQLFTEEYPSDKHASLKFYDVVDFAQNIKPDICFVATADFEWSKKQLAERDKLDRIEKFGDDFHKNVYRLFDSIADDPRVEKNLEEDIYMTRWRIGQMKCYPSSIIKMPSASEHDVEKITEFLCNKVASVIKATKRSENWNS